MIIKARLAERQKAENDIFMKAGSCFLPLKAICIFAESMSNCSEASFFRGNPHMCTEHTVVYPALTSLCALHSPSISLKRSRATLCNLVIMFSGAATGYPVCIIDVRGSLQTA